MAFRHILIIADIEGTTGCRSYDDSRFLAKGWPRACRGMSGDVAAVVQGLFEAGVQTIRIKDFHRTGYNLLPELIDARARVIHGYRRGPVPGLGDPGPAEGVMFIGLHAASGTDGFLAHTLTSRIRELKVNGQPWTEVQFFSAILAPYGIRPLFFSGDPPACRQAEAALPGLMSWPLDKTRDLSADEIVAWRKGLAEAAVRTLNAKGADPYRPQGPFEALVALRDGEEAARKIARRWGWPSRGDAIQVDEPDVHRLFYSLIRLAYLTPWVERGLPVLLPLYNGVGRLGLIWVRRRGWKPLK